MFTLLVDGNYQLHRSMYAGNFINLSTNTGMFTGGCYGFLKSLRKIINDFKPDRVLVLFDGGISERRRMIYPAYKGARYRDTNDPYYEEPDEEKREYIDKFLYQRKLLQSILPNMGIRVLRIKGWEADDLIYACTKYLKGIINIVSDDSDMLQLVGNRINQIRPIKGDLVTRDNFLDVIARTKKLFLLEKAIRGDDSDNIKGVHGVGERTINRVFIEIHPSQIDDFPFVKFFRFCLGHKDKRIRKIAEFKDTVQLNYELVCLEAEDISCIESVVLNTFATATNPDWTRLKLVMCKLQFKSFLSDFDSWITPFLLLE